MYLKMSLGTPPGPKVTKVGPWTPSVQGTDILFDPKGLPKGSRFEVKINSKIGLDSEAEKVVHLDDPRLANGTIGTSKTQQIHWRGGEFQLFALYRSKTVFDRFWSSRGIILGAFLIYFGNDNQSNKNNIKKR